MLTIAIDGPAGSGKTTISRQIAKKLNYQLLDTGAMYRALAYVCKDIAVSSSTFEADVEHRMNGTSFDFFVRDGVTVAMVNGADITHELRTPDVTAHVSKVAALKSVREFAVRFQRSVVESARAAGLGVVVEGRDIGSVVLPGADLKFFLTATPAVRAQRRGIETSRDPALVLVELEERDRLDSERELSPLVKARDAIEIDTSNMSVEEVVNLMHSYVHGHSGV